MDFKIRPIIPEITGVTHNSIGVAIAGFIFLIVFVVASLVITFIDGDRFYNPFT